MRKYFADYSYYKANNLKKLNENKSREINIENINQVRISEESASKKN